MKNFIIFFEMNLRELKMAYSDDSQRVLVKARVLRGYSAADIF